MSLTTLTAPRQRTTAQPKSEQRGTPDAMLREIAFVLEMTRRAKELGTPRTPAVRR